MRVIAYVPDLIDQSRITTIEPAAEFVDRPSDLASASEGADLALVDISRKGAVDVLSGLQCSRVVGFTNHTDRTTMENARAAGAVVMARSEFFIHLEELLLGPDA
ncbi:MAG: hypothetical protein KY395_03895 [Actinobacteria bacterium]|nr:hypothetical protein [Actinomycetota bacterium]